MKKLILLTSLLTSTLSFSNLNDEFQSCDSAYQEANIVKSLIINRESVTAEDAQNAKNLLAKYNLLKQETPKTFNKMSTKMSSKIDSSVSFGETIAPSELEKIKKLTYGQLNHYVQTLLGLERLQNNDMEAAKAHLIDSCKMEGLSFDEKGPNLSLAKAILEADTEEGECLNHKAVQEFLSECQKHWYNKNAHSWNADLNNCEAPNMDSMLKN